MNDDEFDESVLLVLRELAPQMKAAIRLCNRTGELQQNLDSLELALEQFAIGVVVLDNTLGVIFANSTARTQLALKDGLVVRKGKLRTTADRDFGQLRISIERAIQVSDAATAERPGDRSIGVAAISRKHGPGLHAFVAPWLSECQLAITRPADRLQWC